MQPGRVAHCRRVAWSRVSVLARTSMDQVRDHEIGTTQTHAVMEAACCALISVERVSALLPELHQLTDLQSEIDQARESLREAIRQLRLAGVVKPSIQELDFVLPELASRPA